MLASGREYALEIESNDVLGEPEVTWEDLRSADLDTRVWPTLPGRGDLDSDRELTFTYCDVAEPCTRRLKVFLEGDGDEPFIAADDADLQALVSVYEFETDTLYCPVRTDAEGIVTGIVG